MYEINVTLESVVNAIKELSDVFSYSPGINLSELLLVGITAVYAISTIAICVFNYRSVSVAREQVANMRKTQDQSVKIQLFDKRYEIFSLLEKWFSNASVTFSNTEISAVTGQLMTPIEVFEMYVFYQDIAGTNKRLDNLEGLVRADMGNSAAASTLSEVSEMKSEVAKHCTQTILAICEEGNKINMLDLVFSSCNSEQIRKFTDAYVAMARDRSVNNLKNLEEAFSTLDYIQIGTVMRNQLKTMNIAKLQEGDE